MKSRWIFFGLALVFLYLRFQNLAGIFTDAGILPNGTDAYYRLHRMFHLLTQGWTYPLHDRWLSAPLGFDVGWSAGLDALIAYPLKILGVRERAWLEGLAAIAIPVLALPALWLTVSSGTRAAGPRWGWISGLILAFLGGHIQATSVGEIDHHVLEAVFTLGGLGFVWRMRGGADWKLKSAFAVFLGTASLFWPQAWIISVFVAVAVAFDEERRAPAFFAAYAAVFASAAFLGGFIAWAQLGTLRPSWSVFGISYWGAASQSLLAGAAAFAAAWTGRPDRRAYWATLASLGAAGAGLLLWAFDFFAAFSDQFAAVFRWRASLLSVTAEATTPFADPSAALGLGCLPLVLAVSWWGTALLRRERLFLVGYAMAPLFLGCVQVRFLPLASGLIALGAALGIRQVSALASSSRAQRAIIVAGLAVCLLPRALHWMPTRDFNAHPAFRAVMAAAEDLRARQDPTADPASVFAPWDFGHWLLYYGGVSPVTHPFQGGVSTRGTALWIENGVAPLEKFRETMPFRYLVVEAPSGKIERWFRVFGKDPTPYFEGTGGAPGGTLRPKPAFYDLVLPRFYFGLGVDESGNGSKNWRLIYVSPYPAAENPALPALKVFEKVESRAVAVPGLRAGTTYALAAEIDTIDGKAPYRRYAAADAKGTARFEVPYGRMDSPTVRFDGTYLLLHGNKKMRTILPAAPSMRRR